jgi:two-component system sensor histidine kinase/response regulator
MSATTPTVTPLTAPGEPGPARILVVDDHPANVQIVASVLGRLGYEIVPATDGATALKRVELRRPDLILLDLLMPGMGGCEVCQQLKANPDWEDIPVIFLSAADDKELIVRALEAGGVDYITKPFNQAELISRVRTQLALKKARDQLQQLAEDKDELLGVLAHDLKNSLGGINLSAGLLCAQAARWQDERLTQLAENIQRTSAQSLSFVQEFLANAAMDHGFAPQPSAANPVEVARAVVQQYAEPAQRKNISIRTEFPSEAVVVQADVSALDQVLDNLVSNALKFSPPGRNIWLSIRPQADFVECAVRDEGPGFSPGDQARMFRRYGRLTARPTAGEPSTGLGLSIVRKLVLGMRGEVRCESNPGSGAVFTVCLPKPPANSK